MVPPPTDFLDTSLYTARTPMAGILRPIGTGDNDWYLDTPRGPPTTLLFCLVFWDMSIGCVILSCTEFAPLKLVANPLSNTRVPSNSSQVLWTRPHGLYRLYPDGYWVLPYEVEAATPITTP
ncbi:hypothetical protein G9A89_000212 [Geosiphon pyriformis]|nr:hypothetical protein G9A89_000212 [Geosiphon pyriformis]